MEEMIEKLKDALEDEAADVEKYLKMATDAQCDPELCKYAPILGDIAWEEKIHHKHIQAILADIEAKKEEQPDKNAHSEEAGNGGAENAEVD